MPCGHAQRPAGLFWPDGQYCLPRPGPCGLTLDRGDGTGGGERACAGAARDQRVEADAAARGVERRRGQGVSLRDFLTQLAGRPDEPTGRANVRAMTGSATSGAIQTPPRISLRSSGLQDSSKSCDTIITLDRNCAGETVPDRIWPRFRPDSGTPLPRVGFRLGLGHERGIATCLPLAAPPVLRAYTSELAVLKLKRRWF